MQGRNPDIFVNSNYIKNNHKVQTKDVLCNPKNLVNPDSKLGVVGKIKWKPIAEKTRGIASLQL
jgi:hypothetical protein